MKKWAYATGAVISAAVTAMSASAAEMPANPQAILEENWSIIESYCMECHSFDEFRGGLALEGFGPADVYDNPGVFEEVLRKLKIRAMPPRKQPQPDSQERAQFIAALEQTLDAAAAGDPYAGTTTIHRLNRAEYSNAIRDLLGIEIDLTELFESIGLIDGALMNENVIRTE